MNKNYFFYFILIVFLPCYCYAQEKYVVQEAKKQIILTGFSRSRTTTTISSEVSGKVIAVNYRVGQTIAKKPFVEIDPTFIDFQIQTVQNSLKKLDIALKKMKSNVAYLKKEFNRIDELHKGDRATEVKRDAALESLNQAELELDSVEIEKATVQTSLSELAERKKRHSIYAPEGWVIVEKNIEVGENVNPHIPFARTADFRTLIVPLAVSSEEYETIKKLPKEFNSIMDNTNVKASLYTFNPEFNEKTRKLSIELIVASFSGENRGGLEFSLPLNLRTEGLLVPKTAVTNRYDNPRVMIDKTNEIINIMILGESDDNLIISENPKLKVGTEIKPISE